MAALAMLDKSAWVFETSTERTRTRLIAAMQLIQRSAPVPSALF